jgi:hypothetical protein
MGINEKFRFMVRVRATHLVSIYVRSIVLKWQLSIRAVRL